MKKIMAILALIIVVGLTAGCSTLKDILKQLPIDISLCQDSTCLNLHSGDTTQ